MTPRLSMDQFDRLNGLVRAAWVSLNQAGDTPDSHRSLLCLQTAVEDILTVDAALHDDSSLETAVARHHHSFWSRETDALQRLTELAARAEELRSHSTTPQENVPDALLAHSVIPIIWRLIRNCRHEVRSQRPFSYYLRLGRQVARMAVFLVAAWFLFRLVCFVSPWGGGITYFSSHEMDSIRGWSSSFILSQDYGIDRPLPWMRRDAWAARWTAELRVPESAEYSFYAQCAGGMRLWIDDDLLVDHWTSPGWTRGVHAQRQLAEGAHKMKLEYRDRGGQAAVRVRWTGGPIPANTEIGFPHLRKY
jgi:PA14 domain